MIRHLFITANCILALTGCFAQSRQLVDTYLNSLQNLSQSKDIITASSACELINVGREILPMLAAKFNDSTTTEIYSDCQETYLTKGEVAMIIADNIEGMPYAYFTGVQNCLIEFCPDNPNRIEYYFWAIRKQGTKEFQQQYIQWLNSRERKKINRAKPRKPGSKS